MTRYQSDPGQATAYMIGQLDIKSSRDFAKEKLQGNFSLRDFHYQVKIDLSVLHVCSYFFLNAWAGSIPQILPLRAVSKTLRTVFPYTDLPARE